MLVVFLILKLVIKKTREIRRKFCLADNAAGYIYNSQMNHSCERHEKTT